MKDTITKGTGNSRYLKSSLASGTTWASALAQLRAGTFPVDLNGINPNGITQVGSALNKANLMPDDTAEALGLDPADDPQVKDGFEAAADAIENVFRVGDLRSTTRATLGEKWALANGDFVTGREAPDYTALAETPGLSYVDYELPDVGGTPSICFAVTFDESANCLYALGGVPKLVGNISDNYPVAWDIWLFKSLDYGDTWTALHKWREIKPQNMCQPTYYTSTVARNSQTRSFAASLDTYLVTAFVFYKGVIIWLSPRVNVSTSTTGSASTSVSDKLEYYNGTQTADITSQYKYSTSINSFESTDYLFAAYETEINSSQTKGMLLFIGMYTRLFFLAISVSDRVATVSGRAGYGQVTAVGNLNPDGQTRALPTNGRYVHNVHSIIKVPGSNYSLVACGDTNNNTLLAFGRLDCTRLFSDGLIEDDTYMIFKSSSSSVSITAFTYANCNWVNVGTGAVYWWVYGSSNSYAAYGVYFTWSDIITWTTTNYWQKAQYYKTISNAGSSYLLASLAVSPIGLLLHATNNGDGTFLCVGAGGIATLTWNSSTWQFELSSMLAEKTLDDDGRWFWPINTLTRCVTCAVCILSDAIICIPFNREIDTIALPGSYASGRFLPHVDASYLHSGTSSSYVDLDPNTSFFVKIKE